MAIKFFILEAGLRGEFDLFLNFCATAFGAGGSAIMTEKERSVGPVASRAWSVKITDGRRTRVNASVVTVGSDLLVQCDGDASVIDALEKGLDQVLPLTEADLEPGGCIFLEDRLPDGRKSLLMRRASIAA